MRLSRSADIDVNSRTLQLINLLLYQLSYKKAAFEDKRIIYPQHT